MAYIGTPPSNAFTSLLKQDFSTSATTGYTLDHAVNNANDIALFINFVRQEPTAAYSASGTTLTLTSATASSDDMYCVYLGQALQTVNPPNASVGTAQLFSGFKNGITELDQWRLNADTNTGSNADVTSNWERVDSSGWGKIGTGLSTSSGIFSFSQTGIYRIDFRATFSGSTNDALHRFDLLITLDNSSYNIVAQARGGNIDSSITGQSSGSNVFFFDVTDTSLCKFKFTTASFDGSTFLKGSTTFTQTGFEIMRIGDT